MSRSYLKRPYGTLGGHDRRGSEKFEKQHEHRKWRRRAKISLVAGNYERAMWDNFDSRWAWSKDGPQTWFGGPFVDPTWCDEDDKLRHNYKYPESKHIRTNYVFKHGRYGSFYMGNWYFANPCRLDNERQCRYDYKVFMRK